MTKKYFYIHHPEDGGGVAYAPTDIQSDKLIDYRNEQECPFSFELRGGFEKDFVASDIGWQIFSSRARNVIEQAKSGRICWINVHLSSVASKLAPFYALLFDEEFDVLCRERTIYVDDFVVRAVLDPSKIGVALALHTENVLNARF